jgi:hypothetical protein
MRRRGVNAKQAIYETSRRGDHGFYLGLHLETPYLICRFAGQLHIEGNVTPLQVISPHICCVLY